MLGRSLFVSPSVGSSLRRNVFSSSMSSAGMASKISTKSSVPADQLASLVVVVTGENRTGIVSDLCSKVFVPHKVNIGRTRMSTLGTDFGLMAHIDLPNSEVEKLRTTLDTIFPDFVTGVSLQKGNVPRVEPEKKVKRISMIGPDEPGLLAALSKCISENGCNISMLTSETNPASQTGEEMFLSDVVLRVPFDLPDVKLQEEIMKLGEELGVEMTIHDVESGGTGWEV